MAIKNMNDIRDLLSEEIQNVRENKTSAANLNAMTNATGKILSTIKLEMEFAKLTGKKPVNSFVQLEDNVTISKPAKNKPAKNDRAGILA